MRDTNVKYQKGGGRLQFINKYNGKNIRYTNMWKGFLV